MNVIELFAINITFMCFPITLYTILITFKKRFKIGEREIYIELILYLLLFILIYFYSTFKIKEFVCCLTLPILIAFHYKKTKTSIILSIIDILFIIFETGRSPIVILGLFISYFIVYYKYLKTNTTKKKLTILYTIETLVFITFCIIFYNEYSIRNVAIIILYLVTVSIILFIVNKLSILLITYKTLDEIKKDKELRINISKISHEIKTPLVVIKGYLEILNNDNIIKSKNCLLNEVEYALDVLGDFKDINHLTINKNYFIFNDILKDLKYEIIPFYTSKKIDLKFFYDRNMYIYGDKKRIKQVLINIIKNSIESIDKNGKLIISSHIINNNIVIRIKDNGKGMDKDTLDNLFTPFYTKKETGTGLGLCLSKEIIEEHNGTISYFSEINKYTEVKIVIPINNKDNIDCNKQVLVYKD